MAVTIRFSPAQAAQGQPITVQVSTLLAAARIEVWVYSTPDVAPSGEEGWFKLGQVNGQSGSLTWDTARWNPGQYAVAAQAFNSAGALLATWNPRYAGTTVVVSPSTAIILPKTTTSPIPPGPVPQPGPIPSPTPAPGAGGGFLGLTDADQGMLSSVPGIAVVLGLVVGGVLVVRSLSGGGGE